jgi:2-dehydropantoate 2-reductase
MKTIGSVAIIGMGALGILYGHLIGRRIGYENLFFVADAARVRRFNSVGVTCNGEKCPFRMMEAKDAIFATKATGLESAIGLAKQFAGPDTIIISLLNGITSEEIISEKLGGRHVLYTVAQGMDATKIGPDLKYSHPGTLCVGLPAGDQERLPDLEMLCELLTRCDVPFERDPDILHRIWAKWMLNVGVNQLCMVEEGGYAVVQKPGPARDRMIGAMREAMQIALKSGVAVTEKDLSFYVGLIDTLAPEGMPSMRQDGLAHRLSEVESFAGTVVKKGHDLGVPVPVNESLYREIREREAGY